MSDCGETEHRGDREGRKREMGGKKREDGKKKLGGIRMMEVKVN